MIIAIDGYEANVANRVGIGRYAYEIIRNITAISQHKFRIYLPADPAPDMPKPTDHLMYKIIHPKSLWTFVGLPLALMRDSLKPDVIFSPTHYVPRFTKIAKVMSIMDTSYLKFPEMFKAKDHYQLFNWTKYSISACSKILTISEFSKNDIISAYGVDKEKVVVTYPGVTTMSNVKFQMSNVQKKYNIAKNYILSVGTIQPRKNYERLIEAFSVFLKLNKQRFGEIDLVIVGKRGWLYEAIINAPKRFGVGKQVKFLDFVPESDLSSLYIRALCLAQPSLYEGFGLPVLEAMAQNCPVVVSNSSSLPEIAGKAGIYIDPQDTESITQGLLTAVRQRNLMQGKYRQKAGLEQAKKFTWENSARKTLEVLEEVGRGNPKS